MDLINNSSSSDSDDQKWAKFKLPLNPIQGQEKITGNRPTKLHHRLIMENLHDANKISGQIHESTDTVFLNRNQFVPPITSWTLKMAILATTFSQKRLSSTMSSSTFWLNRNYFAAWIIRLTPKMAIMFAYLDQHRTLEMTPFRLESR